MDDLFGSREPIPGLAVQDDFISPPEESELIEHIGTVELSPFRFQGFEGKRLTRSYGWRYDFANGSFAPAEPLPEWLLPLQERAAEFAGLSHDELSHVLLIRYDPGAGIGWHKDRTVFEHVVGISLGQPTAMNFRQRLPAGKFRRSKLPLAPRSAYHLAGEVRHEWEHGIPAHEALRFSITFRSLSELGRRRMTES